MSEETTEQPVESDDQSEAHQGWIPEMANDDDVKAALESAFDYRGDVTITCRDGSVIEGYIFDRSVGDSLASSSVRLYPVDSDNKQTVSFATITRLEFTGRDTAAGKSWETWVKKFNEKKAKGESANIYSDPLDDA